VALITQRSLLVEYVSTSMGSLLGQSMTIHNDYVWDTVENEAESFVARKLKAARPKQAS